MRGVELQGGYGVRVRVCVGVERVLDVALVPVYLSGIYAEFGGRFV